MRTSHCPKTYQLAAAEVANSACFRPFLDKNPGNGAFRTNISPSADAPSAAAASAPTLPQILRHPGQRCRALPGGPRPRHPAISGRRTCRLPAPGDPGGLQVRRWFGHSRTLRHDLREGWPAGHRWCGRVGVSVVGVKCGRTPNVVGGPRPFNDVPAVTYSPTPSRVQYHRRCGS